MREQRLKDGRAKLQRPLRRLGSLSAVRAAGESDVAEQPLQVVQNLMRAKA